MVQNKTKCLGLPDILYKVLFWFFDGPIGEQIEYDQNNERYENLNHKINAYEVDSYVNFVFS